MRDKREELKIGDVINVNKDLSKSSRRRFLKLLGLTGAGTLGVRSAIEKVYGEVKGVPLVHTTDIHGNPDQVRIISKDRHHRLKVYENLSLNKFFKENENVNEITIERQTNNESDLAIKCYINPSTRREKQRLPSKIDDVPVTHETRESGWHPKDDCPNPNRNCRTGKVSDPIKANAQIGPQGDNVFGTLGVVAFNDNSSSPYKCLITADHVMEGAGTMEQPYGGRNVGYFRDRDTSIDSTKYKLDASESAIVGGSMEVNQPRLTGAWTFGGLSDRTDGGTVDCDFAGAESCYKVNACNNTSRSDVVNFEADMRDADTEGGDSGGPYVDNNGKLVCTLYGCQWDWTDNHWDIGPVGGKVLNVLNCTLSKP